MKVIIVDDEPLAISLMKEYLEAFPEIEVIQTCQNGFEALKAIQESKPDLVFLDIQMPKITGLEMLELLDNPPAIVFTTAFDEYAVKAFEVNAVDYLLKPFSQDRLAVAIEKAKAKMGNGTTGQELKGLVDHSFEEKMFRIVVKTGSHIKVIPIGEVQYVEASDDYICIHTAEGQFMKTQTLKSLEKRLDEKQFVRTHRSFLINVQEVTKLEQYEKEGYLVILKSGAKIPVSKSGYTRLRSVLGG
ncbi:LytTR family transcriptional regulator DNA-binding domain-containing protein [Litoribacter ruber]|uniref:LytR/AlgR family response regulator transcription factor n=1 Tax=Litoribacter ruber TaxID=702568 RepID=UPI001BD94650|nr:LytTR family transcriptional regulator DNA-binding domain-containing protein [Litoribacter ruber]MBT0811870.1 LytTR family transcriptional regulator DNA-binding domain-containing protein [Litoribacter ruber]